MADDQIAAALEETRRLVADGDELIDHMQRGQTVTTLEFNAAQDKLAERGLVLLAALDVVLKLTGTWQAEARKRTPRGMGQIAADRADCARQIREAIVLAMTGEAARGQ